MDTHSARDFRPKYESPWTLYVSQSAQPFEVVLAFNRLVTHVYELQIRLEQLEKERENEVPARGDRGDNESGV